jgi:NADH-quinone oxidoreductase subunit C
MSPEEMGTLLKSRFAEAVTEVNCDGAHPHVVVAADKWSEVARFLRDDSRMNFNWLRCITGVDQLEDDQLVAVYDLHALATPGKAGGMWTEQNEFAIKIKVPRGDPHIPSVADVWSAADWHEREAYDLLGIVFDNHPDAFEGENGPHPRRILCPEDWEGFPLRKDYEFPLEYHGIPCVTEYGQMRPQH